MLKNNKGEKITYAEVAEFVFLMISVSAMDSENMALPILIALLSALSLLMASLKREEEIPTQTDNQSGDNK